jgi:hypothetical protein
MPIVASALLATDSRNFTFLSFNRNAISSVPS